MAKMSKNEVVENLKIIASKQKDKKYITLKDLRLIPGLEYYVYFHFSNLGNALQTANLPSSKLASSMKIKSEDLLKYLRDLRDKLNRNPIVYDLDRDNENYKKYSERKFTWALFKTRFGGLREALKQMQSAYPKAGTTDTSVKATQKEDLKKENPEFFYNKARFLGKGAELHVTAELMYRGFQAANIPIDEGLDVLAVKRNKTYYFQVKHKDIDTGEGISVTKSSFERSGSGDVYYIFVLLSEKRRDFLIIPYHIIDDWIRQGLGGDKSNIYIFYIKKEGDNYQLKDIILNKYLGAWHLIR